LRKACSSEGILDLGFEAEVKLSIHGVLAIIQKVHICQKFRCIFSYRPGMMEISETNNGVNSGGVVMINSLQLTLERRVIKVEQMQGVLGNGTGPLESVVGKVPKHEQDLRMVIPKCGEMQIESQFTLDDEVLKL